jgi:MoxR-like ATPase
MANAATPLPYGATPPLSPVPTALSNTNANVLGNGNSDSISAISSTFEERCARFQETYGKNAVPFVTNFKTVREKISQCLDGSLDQKDAIIWLKSLLKASEKLTTMSDNLLHNRLCGIANEIIMCDVLLYLIPKAFSSSSQNLCLIREELAHLLFVTMKNTFSAIALNNSHVLSTKAALDTFLTNSDFLQQMIGLAASASEENVNTVFHVISAMNELAELSDEEVFGHCLTRVSLEPLQLFGLRHRPEFSVLKTPAIALNAIEYDQQTHELINTSQIVCEVQFNDSCSVQIKPGKLQLVSFSDKVIKLGVAFSTPDACSMLKLLSKIPLDNSSRPHLMVPVVQGLLSSKDCNLVLSALSAHPTACGHTEGKVLVKALCEDRNLSLTESRCAVEMLSAQLSALDSIDCQNSASLLLEENLSFLIDPPVSMVETKRRNLSLMFIAAALPRCSPTQSLVDVIPAMLTLLTGVRLLGMKGGGISSSASMCCLDEMLPMVLQSLEFLTARHPEAQLSMLLLLLARHAAGGDDACFRVDKVKAAFATASSHVGGVRRWAEDVVQSDLEEVSHALTALIVRAPTQPEGLAAWPLLGELMQSHFSKVEAALSENEKISLCHSGSKLLKDSSGRPISTISCIPQLIMDLSRSCVSVRSKVAATIWLLPTAHVSLAQPIIVDTLAAVLGGIASTPDSSIGITEELLVHSSLVAKQKWYKPHLVDTDDHLSPEEAIMRRLRLSSNPLLSAALWTIFHHAQFSDTANQADKLAQALLKCLNDPVNREVVSKHLATMPASILPWLSASSKELRKSAASIISLVLEAPSDLRAAIFAGAMKDVPHGSHENQSATTGVAEGNSPMFLTDEVDNDKDSSLSNSLSKKTLPRHFSKLKKVLSDAISAASDEKDAFAVIRSGLQIPTTITDALANPPAGHKSRLLYTKTTMANLQQIADAAQCNTPLLLEGGPGVGKSATIEEAAALAGRELVRFNLCSHTGIDDLIARVTIKPNKRTGEPDVDLFLQPFAVAFSEGRWLLLDELNLAPDSVLKCLEEALETRILRIDHPADADFAPLQLHPNFRLFATQNPSLGFFAGKREKLSGAFLNRFTPVVFKELPRDDWVRIAEKKLEGCLGKFTKEIASAVVAWHFKFKGIVESVSPPFPERASYTETSLRDMLRLLDLLVLNKKAVSAANLRWKAIVAEHAWVVYGARLRTEPAKKKVLDEMSTERYFGAGISNILAKNSWLENIDEEQGAQENLAERVVIAAREQDATLFPPPSREGYLRSLLAQEQGLDLSHETIELMVTTHIEIMESVREPQFISEHGVCSLSDTALVVWAQNIKSPTLDADAAIEGVSVYCDQQRHVTARLEICSILAEYLKVPYENLKTHASKKMSTLRPSFAITPRVAAVWHVTMSALNTKQPLMLVGPVGCGKSHSLLALMRLLNRRVEQVCMTPETEPSELVGAYIPQTGAAKSIKWANGSVTRSYIDGSCLLLDNVQDANACVMERLNSVLEKPATLLLVEKGESKPEIQHDNFRALATLSIGTNADISPALANRFALVFMPDLDFASSREELLAIAKVVSEEGVDVKMVASAASSIWEASCSSSLIRDAGIDMRCVIRFIDASYHLRRHFNGLSTQDSLRHAFQLIISRQLADQASALQTLEQKVLSALGLTLQNTPVLGHLRYSGVSGEGEVGQHVLPASRLPNANALAACVLCGYPALLEGSPAVGKTSLVDSLAKAGHITLRRVNNSDTTSIQDYLGSLLPFNGTFQYQPGELVKAMEAGDWFLADEFNLADPAVMAMLSPLLEGGRELTVPGVGVRIASPDFRFFATQNPSTDAGRFKLPPSLQTRFVKIVVDNFTEHDLQIIIQRRTDDPPIGLPAAAYVSTQDASCLAKAYFELPKASPDVRLTLREIVKWLRRKSIFSSKTLRSVGEMLLSARTLPNTEQHEKLKDAFTKSGFSVGGVLTFGSIEIKPKSKDRDGIVSFKDFEGHLLVELDSTATSSILPPALQIPTQALTRTLTYAAAALKAREPVLLVGPSGHKSTAVTTMAALLGRTSELTVMHLTPETETADMLGQIIPMGTSALLDDAMYQLEVILSRYRALAGQGGFLSTSNSLALQSGILALNHLREQASLHATNSAYAASLAVDESKEAVQTVDTDALDDQGAELMLALHQMGEAFQPTVSGPSTEAQEEPEFDFSLLISSEETLKVDEEKPTFDFDMLISSNEPDTGKEIAEKEVSVDDLGSDKSREGNNESVGGIATAPTRPSTSSFEVEYPALAEALKQGTIALESMLKACDANALILKDACFLVAVDKYFERVSSLSHSNTINFVFRDGPVTRAIKLGRILLLEGFDLPEASVTERLNSLLEPTPFFSLTEDFTLSAHGCELSRAFQKKPRISEITPLRSFVFFATVHRAEIASPLRLSRAARSRLTEIACSSYTSDNIDSDLWRILEAQLAKRIEAQLAKRSNKKEKEKESHWVCQLIFEAYHQAQQKSEARRHPIDIHKLFCLLDFIVSHPPSLPLLERILTGIRFLWLDAWPISTESEATNQEQDFSSPAVNVLAAIYTAAGKKKDKAHNYIQKMLYLHPPASTWSDILSVTAAEDGRPIITCKFTGVSTIVSPIRSKDKKIAFEVSVTSIENELRDISFEGGTFVTNLARIFAGLAAEAPVLLEGPPGVGKTAVVTRAANMLLGHGNCERINMSTSITVEQLFGSVYPQLAQGKKVFVWRDGSLTQALKSGKWVLFDELNLAPAAVLDAIAPLLRRRVDGVDFIIPGSNETINVTTTRFFATMNPQSVGGNRSRLPRSVDSLFVKVTLSAYSPRELLHITYTLFDQLLERPAMLTRLRSHHQQLDWNFITQSQLERLLKLQGRLNDLVAKRQIGRLGGPYEFNLRDLVKFRDVLAANAENLRGQFTFLVKSSKNSKNDNPSEHDVRLFTLRTIATLVYSQRFQVSSERELVNALICEDQEFFALPPGAQDLTQMLPPMVDISVPGYLRVGSVYMPVNESNTIELVSSTPTIKELLLPGNSPQLVHTPQTIKQLEVLSAALQSRRAILLEGDTASRKTSLVRELARLTNNKLVVIPMNLDTEVAQLVGQWLPRKEVGNRALKKSRAPAILKELIAFVAVSIAPECVGDLKQVADVFFSALQTCLEDVLELVSRDIEVQSGKEDDQQAQTADQHAEESIFSKRAHLHDLLSEAIKDVHRDGSKLYEFALKDSHKTISSSVLHAFNAHLTRLDLLVYRFDEEARVQRLLHRQNEANSSKQSSGSMGFQFVESALVSAIREGNWVLLDGINNAPPEVVERLNSLAEEHPMLNLFESDKPELLEGKSIHAGFRLLATASFNREQSNKLSSAFLNRLIRIWLDAGDIDLRSSQPLSSPLDADAYMVVRNILQGMYGGKHMSSILLGFHSSVLSHISSGKAHLIPGVVVTLRTLISAARSAAIMSGTGLEPLYAVTWAVLLHYLSCVQSGAELKGLLSELSNQADMCQKLGTAYIRLQPPVVAQSSLQHSEQLVLKCMPALEHSSRRLITAAILASSLWEPSKTSAVVSTLVHAVLLPQLPEKSSAQTYLTSLHTSTQTVIWNGLRAYEPLGLAESTMSATELLSDVEASTMETQNAVLKLINTMTLLDMDVRLVYVRRIIASVDALTTSAKAAYDAEPPQPWRDALLKLMQPLLSIRAVLSLPAAATNMRSTLLQLRSELTTRLHENGNHVATFALNKVTTVPLQSLADFLLPFTEAMEKSRVGYTEELLRFRLAAQVVSHYWRLLLRDSDTISSLARERHSADSLSLKTVRTIELILTLDACAKCIEGTQLSAFVDAAQSLQTETQNTNQKRIRYHNELKNYTSNERNDDSTHEKAGTKAKPRVNNLHKAREEVTSAEINLDAARRRVAKTRIGLRELSMKAEFNDLDMALRQLEQAGAFSVCSALVNSWNAPHLRDIRTALNVERVLQSGIIHTESLSIFQGQAHENLHTLASVLPIVTSDLRKQIEGAHSFFINTQIPAARTLDADTLLDTSTPAIALLTSTASFGVMQSLILKIPRAGVRGVQLPPSFFHFVCTGVEANFHMQWVEDAARTTSIDISSVSAVTTFRVPLPTESPVPIVQREHWRTNVLREVTPTLLQASALSGFAIAICARGLLQPEANGGEKNLIIDTDLKSFIDNSSYQALLSGRDALDSVLCRLKNAVSRQGSVEASSVALAHSIKNLFQKLDTWAEQVPLDNDGFSNSVPSLPSHHGDIRAIIEGSKRLNEPLEALVKAVIPDDDDVCAVSAKDRVQKFEAAGVGKRACPYLYDRIDRILTTVDAHKRKQAFEYRTFYHNVAASITAYALAVAARAPLGSPAFTKNGLLELTKYYYLTLDPMFNALQISVIADKVKLTPSSRVNSTVLETWGHSTETIAKKLLLLVPDALAKLKLDVASHVSFTNLFLNIDSSDDTMEDESMGLSADAEKRLKKLADLQRQISFLLAEAKQCSPSALPVIHGSRSLTVSVEKLSAEVRKVNI